MDESKKQELRTKERRKKFSQSKGTKNTIEEEDNMEESLSDLNHSIRAHPYKLHYAREKVLQEHGRRHTCDQAMYRDKVNFDYKHGLKVQKQYSLQ